MKNYKKYLCFALIFTMLLAISTACGSENEGATDATVNDNLSDITANDNSSDTTTNENNTDVTTFSYSEGIGENGFLDGVVALDYVDIIDYQAISVPNNIHQISEDTIQVEIDNLLANYSSYEQITDRAVVDGDTVNIDYVGSVDGVEFEGGSTNGGGTEVTIGVTSYIDDFLEQLIGHKPGETINVEVTFPDVYQEASLEGKDALFVTTINYIIEEIQPELTDDFVATNFSSYYGWETVDEMKEDMSTELRRTAIQQYIDEYLINGVTIHSVPDNLVEYQENIMLQYYREISEYYGMEFDEFLNLYVGVSSESELTEVNRDGNVQNAKYNLVYQAIAEDMGISVSDEDIETYIPDYSLYVEQYGLPYLKQYALIQKVLDKITDNAIFE